MHDRDYIVCECALEPLKSFTEQQLEPRYSIRLVKPPAICLTMVRAQDSVEYQEFYLGEALTTECEVEISGATGYGICLGDEPERAYCLAVIDALYRRDDEYVPVIEEFLAAQWEAIQQREKEEFNQILRTRVDFKLMDEA